MARSEEAAHGRDVARAMRSGLGRVLGATKDRARRGVGRALVLVLGSSLVRRRVPLPRVFDEIVARSADPAGIADESIRYLKSYVPIDVTALVGNYFEGLWPYGYYDRADEYYWSVPQNRCMITCETARVPSRVRRDLNKLDLEVRFDEDAEAIIRGCQRSDGTWLNEPLIAALLEAVDAGLCTTVGAYRDGELVGGEFGLDIAGWWIGMSSFHRASNAGNAVRAAAVREVMSSGRFSVIDCGEMKEHAKRFGATIVSEDEFHRLLVAHIGAAAAPRPDGTPDATEGSEPR